MFWLGRDAFAASESIQGRDKEFQRFRENTVEEESRGVGCKRKEVILVTYSHGAEVMSTSEHLEMEVGEEECVQVIKSLINVSPWRMCVTARCTTGGWNVTAIKQTCRSL